MYNRRNIQEHEPLQFENNNISYQPRIIHPGVDQDSGQAFVGHIQSTWSRSPVSEITTSLNEMKMEMLTVLKL